VIALDAVDPRRSLCCASLSTVMATFGLRGCASGKRKARKGNEKGAHVYLWPPGPDT